MVLSKVGVLSVGKVLGVLYTVLGFIAGAFVSLFSIIGAAFGGGGHDSPGALFGLIFGVAAIVAMPLFYGAMGFVGGVISAFLYNVVAGFTGGVEVEFTEAASDQHAIQ